MSDRAASSDEKGKLVAHFKDGQIRKGFSRDFDPTRESFHLVRREGEIASSEEIRIEDLKALFHVKTWGRKDRHRGVVPRFPPDGGTPPPSGETPGMIKTVLEFFDGEKIFCYSDDYDPGSRGFFALPADPADNNRKIYVVNSSLINIEFYRA